jgi:hypothetical protein
MKLSNGKTLAIIIAYIFLLLICRGAYLYFGERMSALQSLTEVMAEVGNFAIIAIFGFFLAFVFFYVAEKLRRKTRDQNSALDKVKDNDD